MADQSLQERTIASVPSRVPAPVRDIGPRPTRMADVSRYILENHLTGSEVQVPDRAADNVTKTPEDARKGIAVREFKDKFRREYAQTENASLEDSQRANVAESVLRQKKLLKEGEKLNETQERALLKAHYANDPFEKVKALREGGFDRNQTRALIESHLAGMMPPTNADVPPIYDNQIQAIIEALDPASFPNDAELSNFARKIKELHGSDFLDRGMLEGFAKDIKKHAEEVPTADMVKTKELYDAVSQIAILDDARTGRIDPRQRGSEYAEEIKRYRDLKARIDAGEPGLEVQRKDVVRDIASSINLQSGGRDNDELFKIIIEEHNSLEYLINRLVSAPLDSETGEWSLGLYGQSNLDSITSILKTQKDNFVGATDEETRIIRTQRNIDYQSALEIEESIRLAHEVNKAIVNADLSTFSRIAGSLSDERLSRLSRVKGVGVISRLLEAEHGSLIAKDTWINSQNYAEMMGRVKDSEGLLKGDQANSALESFRDLVKKAHSRVSDDPNAPDELKELSELDDWQVDLAFNVGRAMYNLSLRAAEWISQGEVPPGDKSTVSFPQEKIARILNWPSWMLKRFNISESRGGMEFLDNVLKTYQGTREKDGYGEMGLEKIGGKEIKIFEMPDMTGARGWWASWRGRQLMMETIPLQFRRFGGIGPIGGKNRVEREGKEIKADSITDLGVLLDFPAIKVNDKKFNDLSDGDKADYIKSVFMDGDHLRADFNRGLGGALYFGLKPSTSGHHPDGSDYLAVKEDIRRKIWEKAAEENPLGVIPYLNGLKYKDGPTVKIVPDRGSTPEKKKEWQEFSRKLFQLNEIKMQKIKRWDPDLQSQNESTRSHALEELGKITLESIIAEEHARRVPTDQKITLIPKEIELLKTIREAGKRAAPHLANIRFAHIPFMNDLSLEKIDYGIVGAEAYSRMLNDTGQFQAANDALIKLMNNPSKFKEPEEINEIMMPFIDNVGGVLGTDVGQKKGYVWIEGVLDMYERGANTPTHKIKVPDIGPIKFKPIELKTLAFAERKFRQFPLINEILRFTRQANSKAQNTAGPDASVWDNQKLFKASEEALHAGVMSEEEIKKFRKRFGNRLWMQFKMFLRAALGGVTVAVADLPGREFKDLKI